MKKILSIVFILTSLFSVCNAKPKKKADKTPLWMNDEGRLQIFPREEYLSAFSFGSSEQESKAKAASAISQQIKTQVETEINSVYEGTESADFVQSRKRILQNITLSGDNALYQLEYTVPFYNDDMGMFACVAYINRSSAWDSIKPKLDSISKNFKSAYIYASDIEDSFEKYSALITARSLLDEFYEYYNFALVVCKNDVGAFKNIDELAYESYLESIDLAKKCIVKINITGDKDKRVYSKFSEIMTKKGFLISDNNSNYEAKIEIKANAIDNGDVWSCYPSININIDGENGTVYSYSKQFEKVAGFELETCLRKVYKEIEKALTQDL